MQVAVETTGIHTYCSVVVCYDFLVFIAYEETNVQQKACQARRIQTALNSGCFAPKNKLCPIQLRKR
jgi:hypothetical protein